MPFIDKYISKCYSFYGKVSHRYRRNNIIKGIVMIKEITPGDRLKGLINKQGWIDKDFAVECGTDPATLSRYVNNKRKMSDKFLEKAAQILGTNVEYLKCETNDPSNNEVKRYYEDDSEEERERNRFIYRCSGIYEMLKVFGVTVTHRLFIRDMQFQQHKDLIWYPINDAAIAKYGGYGLDNIEYIEEIAKQPQDCHFETDVEYRGKVITMSEKEYNEWQMRLVSSFANMLDDKFDCPYTYTHEIPRSNIEKMLGYNWTIKNNPGAD